VDAYKAWIKNGSNQFEMGRVKKRAYLVRAFDLIVVLLKKVCMVGAALMMAMVSSGRSMLARQWLLARAAAAEKYYIYSIFISTW
jgi:hypothetical protein